MTRWVMLCAASEGDAGPGRSEGTQNAAQKLISSSFYMLTPGRDRHSKGSHII